MSQTPQQILAPLQPLPKSPPARPAARRYAVAIASVLLGWAVREALSNWIGPTAVPFIAFFPAVAWAAWYGGIGPAVLAVLLSAIVANWAFVAPVGTWHFDDPLVFIAFPVSAAFIVAAIEIMHRTRRELDRARELLSTTLTSIGDGVIVTDSDGKITFINGEAERLTGWVNAEAQGRPLGEVFRIVNERTREPVESPVERVLRLGAVVGLANHTVLLARDGRETAIDDSAAPIRRPDGPVLGAVLVFRDVREARAAAEAQSRLAAIVASSGDAILSKDLDGTIRSWNAGAQRLFGFTSEEIVGKSITAIVPRENADEEAGLLARLREGRGTAQLLTVRLAKDGRRIPVSLTNSPVRDSDGTIVGASTILHDMSAVNAAQKALAREKELISTTLSSIGDAVIATDAQGRVTFLNPIAHQLTGWSQEEAAGLSLVEVFKIINEQSRLAVDNPAIRAMKTGEIVAMANHTLLVSRTGQERPIDDSAAPIRDETRAVVGSVLVFRDVTERRRADRERKRLEDELRTRVAQLSEVNRLKSEFLATLSHELRNPLAPIRNSIALLQLRGPQDSELVAARDVIDRQVELMSRLLDDLLDVNRLDRHKLELRRERVSLSDVIQSAVETARPSIDQARHKLSIELPPGPIAIDADPMRLAQVFSNLLTNAAKYTDPGGWIALTGRRDGNQVAISVADSGIGIDRQSLDGLFEMFAQVPAAMARAQGGVGIGLSLAKGLVELHGGTISARSEGLGKGSVFTVRLPIANGMPVERGAQPAVVRSVNKRRILICDDLKDNADSLARMLRALGHDVHAVYGGESAVAQAEALRPEVVLLDIGMPGLNGYDACRRIRSQPWGKSMYLIAQTGWGEEADRRRAADAGFDRHMLKPVQCEALAAVLDAIPSPRLKD